MLAPQQFLYLLGILERPHGYNAGTNMLSYMWSIVQVALTHLWNFRSPNRCAYVCVCVCVCGGYSQHEIFLRLLSKYSARWSINLLYSTWEQIFKMQKDSLRTATFRNALLRTCFVLDVRERNKRGSTTIRLLFYMFSSSSSQVLYGHKYLY